MASIHKQPGKPFWYCAFTSKTPDGVFKRHFKSTKTGSRKQAGEISRRNLPGLGAGGTTGQQWPPDARSSAGRDRARRFRHPNCRRS